MSGSLMDNNSLVNTLKTSTRGRISHPTVFENSLGTVRIVSLAVVLLIAWVDYITGYEFGFFIFYFIPVAISAWYCSDKYTNHPYSNAYFIYWEMFMRLISFLTTSITLSKIRRLVLNEERMIVELLD